MFLKTNTTRIKQIVLMMLMVLSTFFLFIQPVEAYTVKRGVLFTEIGCDKCGTNHYMTTWDYDNLYAPISTETAVINCILCGGTHCKLVMQENPTKKLAYNVAVAANSSLTDYKAVTFDSSNGFSLEEILAFDTKTSGDNGFGDELDTINMHIFPALVPIGLVIIAIYFVLELGEAALDDKMTYEHLIFMFIKVVISIIVVTTASDFIVMGSETMKHIFEALNATPDGGTIAIYSPANCIFVQIQNNGVMTILGELAMNALYCIFVWFAYMYIYIHCWARLFDIFIRIIFAPIGLADFMHGGTSCLAVKYMKKLLSSILQGACIVGVITAYNVINHAVRGNDGGAFIAVVVGMAVCTAVKNTQQIANDAIGIN